MEDDILYMSQNISYSDNDNNDNDNYEFQRLENVCLFESDDLSEYLSTERDHVMMAVQYYMYKQRIDYLYRDLPAKTKKYIDVINMYCNKVKNDYASEMNIMNDIVSTKSFTIYDINNEINSILISNKGLGIRLATISFVSSLSRRCINRLETVKMFTLLSHTICDDYFIDYITDIVKRNTANKYTYTSLKLIGITVFMFATYKTLKYIMR
ncbi:caspase-9 inhibitor [Skunkpox virus]|uniref:Caspase-9 inhibitor n=1 Tax=Skunkpox virus TaxID=160796 RepID=A0A1C9KBM0_9POXV|nr:caspase-9 inhibitor [Skunkpox virus]AOP31516.1 caspase-9 inhibitor [Skunkpox virus]